MSVNFYCSSKECKKAFYLEVPDEIMIDESNMAVFYCPHCAHKLSSSHFAPNFSAQKIAKCHGPDNNM